MENCYEDQKKSAYQRELRKKRKEEEEKKQEKEKEKRIRIELSGCDIKKINDHTDVVHRNLQRLFGSH